MLDISLVLVLQEEAWRKAGPEVRLEKAQLAPSASDLQRRRAASCLEQSQNGGTGVPRL